eukprot:GILK01008942.1.p1 GENE.GILK01008942.1~~GILK01008942.1.p1  ORF type:complete len:173 (-),score=38.90 GILK01008942.1:542-1021(-)
MAETEGSSAKRPRVEAERSAAKPSLYLVNVVSVAPVYDIHVRSKTSLYHDRSTAIQAAQDLLFREVDSSFRGGAERCTGIKFKRNEIEQYNEEHYANLWATCDTAAAVDSPGGPAWVVVYELTPAAEDAQPWIQTEIYRLPPAEANGEEEKEEDEEDDE